MSWKRVWVCWWMKKEKAQKSRGKRCVLLTGRYQLRGAFETVALAPGQANQERSSAVVKRDRLSSIDITGRAVDKVVPESGLVALERIPWSPWPKASPRAHMRPGCHFSLAHCAAQWIIASRKGLVSTECPHLLHHTNALCAYSCNTADSWTVASSTSFPLHHMFQTATSSSPRTEATDAP